MITKNIKHIVAAFCVGCGIAATPALSSCSDYLDKEPDIELTTDMVFQNRDKVYGWPISTTPSYMLPTNGASPATAMR